MKNPNREYSKINYNFVLARWFFNYGWVWVVGFLLSWINTLTVVYYLIPAVKDSMPFKNFIFIGSAVLIVTSTIIGWFLIKILRVQSIETKIGTDVNPYAHSKLTRKELTLWRLLVSTAEQVQELSKPKDKEKKELFQKRIDRAKEFLTNTRAPQLDLLHKPEFANDKD